MWAFCGEREENLFQPPDNILPLGRNYSLAFFISLQTTHQKRPPPNPKHGHLFGTFHGILLLLSGCAQHRHTLAQKAKQNRLDLFNQFCSICTAPLPQPKTLVFLLWVTGEALIELLSCLVAILHTWPRYLPSTRNSGGPTGSWGRQEKEAMIGALNSHPHFSQSIPCLSESSMILLCKTSFVLPKL